MGKQKMDKTPSPDLTENRRDGFLEMKKQARRVGSLNSSPATPINDANKVPTTDPDADTDTADIYKHSGYGHLDPDGQRRRRPRH